MRGLKGEVGRQANGRRALLAEYAVNARIITSQELPLLDDPDKVLETIFAAGTGRSG